MLGWRFLATATGRAAGKDWNFLPKKKGQHEYGRRIIPLDDTEAHFKAMAEAAKRRGKVRRKRGA